MQGRLLLPGNPVRLLKVSPRLPFLRQGASLKCTAAQALPRLFRRHSSDTGSQLPLRYGRKMGKEIELNAANTSAYVQVLGVGADAPSSSSSVLLFFDRQRYLFNMGEGFQRYCVEHRIKLSRMSALLLTRVGAATAGGLPGALLTMADTSAGGLLAGQAALGVHGPPGLATLVNAYRTFVNVKDIGLAVTEAKPATPAIDNELVTITPILLNPPAAGTADGKGTESEFQNGTADDSVTGGSGSPSAKRARTTAGSATPAPAVNGTAGIVACYTAQLPDIPGKFLPQKAAALGVPRGPSYGRLVRGESVTSTSGATITPADVMEPGTPGPAVLVVDCPSADYLPALQASQELAAWMDGSDRAGRVACVVHLAPPAVLETPVYKAWATRFDPGTNHILAGLPGERGEPVMRCSAVVQARLSTLDASLFPLQQSLAGAVRGQNLLKYHLRPVARRGLDSSEVPEALSAATVREELALSPAGAALAELAKAAPGSNGSAAPAHPPACIATAGRRSFELTFLGTGAAIPSKYRNVTGSLVDLFDHGALLVDCGEGSLGQLERSLGSAAVAELLARLRLVWVSHIHADHHVGLASVLAARRRVAPSAPPLVVLGPRPLRRVVQTYSLVEGAPVTWVDAVHSDPGSSSAKEADPAAVETLSALRTTMGLSRLESFRVDHCAHAYGLALESAEAGWKVVFSGDTRPCEAVRTAAAGATLLVHEATFEDELLEEAQAKNHCTTSEAVDTAVRAGAYRTILTHFSQRYPKIPVIDENFQGSVAIAFDLMRVNLADLPRLPALVPGLKALFAEQEEEAQETAA